MAEIPDAPPEERFESGGRLWSRFFRTRSAVAGLALIVLLAVAAVFARWIAPSSPYTTFTQFNTGPSSSHWLGTDDVGRDILSRIIYGGQVSLQATFQIVGLALIAALPLGLVAGYFGGWIDTVTNWLVNIVVAFPFYVLIIALAFALGPGARSIYISITIVGWVSYARIVRGEVIVAKRREYVLAARAGGLSTRRILLRHLLPNTITQAIVFACSDICLDILAIVTLGYLGLGIQPPNPDWGRMIADGQTYLTTHWELSTFPGIAIVIAALGLSLLADGLADLLRPE